MQTLFTKRMDFSHLHFVEFLMGIKHMYVHKIYLWFPRKLIAISIILFSTFFAVYLDDKYMGCTITVQLDSRNHVKVAQTKAHYT